MYNKERLESLIMKNGDFRKYTMVGAYPVFYLTDANDCICPECATELKKDDYTQLHSFAINWGSILYCDECSAEIEAAYT